MFTWDIITKEQTPSGEEWSQLVAKILGNEVHPSRKVGFLLSRLALLNVLKKLGINPEIKHLELKNFHELTHYPRVTLSLSHSKEGAAAVASIEENLSLGIDIESKDRHVSQETFERVSHCEDISLTNIKIWCLKEAALKCLMNTERFEKTVSFADIRIEKNQWTHSPSSLSGKWEIHEKDPFILALCWMENGRPSPQLPG